MTRIRDDKPTILREVQFHSLIDSIHYAQTETYQIRAKKLSD